MSLLILHIIQIILKNNYITVTTQSPRAYKTWVAVLSAVQLYMDYCLLSLGYLELVISIIVIVDKIVQWYSSYTHWQSS